MTKTGKKKTSRKTTTVNKPVKPATPARKKARPGARKGEAVSAASGRGRDRSFSALANYRRTRRVMKTSELIARDIIMDISEGGLQKGDSLPAEAAMLAHYEVGRASLREALRLLEFHGLIKIRAGAKGGPVVGAATAQNLGQILTLYLGLSGATYDDLTDVMLILYPMVAEVVAKQELSRREQNALIASVEQCDPKRIPSDIITDSHANFHRLLAQFSHNPVWALINDALGLVFVDHIVSTMDSSDFHDVAAADHREIAEAIIGHDPERAHDLMLEHTKRIIEFYRSHMPGVFSQLIEWR